MNPRRFAALVLPSVCAFAVGCGAEPGDAPAGVTVGALPNGAPLVLNAGDGAWAEAGAEPWRLVEDLQIGRLTGEGPDVFGSARNIVPDPAGRIWVMDGQAHELRQFDTDGTHIRTVGGEGDGPGEFGFNPCMVEGPNDEIWVEAGGRWQWFDTAGTLLGAHPVTRSLGCGIQGRRGDQFYAVTLTGRPGQEQESFLQILERTPDGGVIIPDTLPLYMPEWEVPRAIWTRPGGGQIRLYVPFAHRPTRSFSRDGAIFYATPEAYRVVKTNFELDTLLAFERMTGAAVIPSAVRDSAIRALRRDDLGMPDDFDRDDVPTTHRWVERIHSSDDGSIWVQRRDATGEPTFDVFNAGGVFQGSVDAPPGFESMSVARVTGNHVYVNYSDEFDVDYVLRFRIERP